VSSGSSVSDTAVAIVNVVPTAYTIRLPAAPDQWRVIAVRDYHVHSHVDSGYICFVET